MTVQMQQKFVKWNIIKHFKSKKSNFFQDIDRITNFSTFFKLSPLPNLIPNMSLLSIIIIINFVN